MGRRAAVVMPQTQRLPGKMGEQIRPARLRRHLPSEPVAERAGISGQTVTAVEKGNDARHSRHDTDGPGLCSVRTNEMFSRRSAWYERSVRK